MESIKNQIEKMQAQLSELSVERILKIEQSTTENSQRITSLELALENQKYNESTDLDRVESQEVVFMKF
jgi:hypothetical protein